MEAPQNPVVQRAIVTAVTKRAYDDDPLAAPCVLCLGHGNHRAAALPGCRHYSRRGASSQSI